MTKYKIYNVASGVATGQFIQKEIDTSDYSDMLILDWETKRKKTSLLNKPLDNKYKFAGDIEKIKTYYFVPGTVFDRDYFKRLYPDLTYTRIIKNVDLIIYDLDTGHKFINNTKIIRNHYGSHVDETAKIIYVFDNYQTRRNFIKKDGQYLSTEYDDILLYCRTEAKDALGKMMLVDDVFKTKKNSLVSQDVSLQSIGQLFAQLVCTDSKVVKSAMDCVLNYSDDYLLTKLTLLSLITISKSIFSNGKAKFFYNTNKHKMFFRAKYCANTLIEYVESLNRIASNYPFMAKDIELVNEIINSSNFQKIWDSKSNLEYSVKFKIAGQPIADTAVVSPDQNGLPEFAV